MVSTPRSPHVRTPLWTRLLWSTVEATVPLQTCRKALRGATMVLAADYPFLNILWTMIIFFAWVAWLWIVITVFTDLFRRHDIGGLGEAGLVGFLVVLAVPGAVVSPLAPPQGLAAGHVEKTQGQKGA